MAGALQTGHSGPCRAVRVTGANVVGERLAQRFKSGSGRFAGDEAASRNARRKTILDKSPRHLTLSAFARTLLFAFEFLTTAARKLLAGPVGVRIVTARCFRRRWSPRRTRTRTSLGW